MRRLFNPFSFDASVNYRDANCRKKVHEVVLIHRLISRQLPFCVFDDAFNLVHGRFDTKSFRYKVVSIKSRFDSSRFDTSGSRFVTNVKSIRYKLLSSNDILDPFVG